MKTAIIIPSYKVKNHIVDLIQKLILTDYNVYVVDDCCPEKSGNYVEQNFKHPQVKVIYNEKNLGVGGAVKRGFKEALKDDCELFVKLDGDGQMDPQLIPGLILPILNAEADVSKGNRFYNINTLIKMPILRLFGNSALSFINKIVSGYWKIMDPTNGFIALHKTAIELLPLDKIDNRYFFESDLLFRLGTIRAVVSDFSMDAKYEDEESGLSIKKVLVEFPPKYLTRFIKRVFYTYFLRDFNIGTVELMFGNILFLFGIVYGSISWIQSSKAQIATPTGTVMIAVLSIILGFQLLLSFINYDINNAPTKPLTKKKV